MLPKSVTPFFSSLFKNINNMQIQLKKIFLCHVEKLFSLLFHDSLLDYSYKNAICRDGQTCWGKIRTSLECLPILGIVFLFFFLQSFLFNFKRLS